MNGLPQTFATLVSEDTHWLLLLAQSVAFVVSVAIILRLSVEKRTPSNIFAWSLLLLFMPIVGVPLYMLFGGRKIRHLVAEKSRIRRIASMAARDCAGCAASAGAGGGVSEGNVVRILEDGVEGYRAMCREIDRARQRIEITTFILGRDNVGRSIIRRLAVRAREGVRVRLLIDALGSLGVGDGLLRDLRRAGGEVHRFIPLFPIVTKASANLRNHRKIAIFDGTRAIVGGQNLDRRFLSPSNDKTLFADMSLLVEGPAVTAMSQVFVGDWAFAGKHDVGGLAHLLAAPAPCYGSSRLEVIPSGPDVEGDPLWERIITLVQEARESIDIVTPYFLPDEVLLRSLIIKAHAGRRVRIFVPEHSNHPIADFARNRFLRHLHAQGVEILLFRKRMLHAKLIVVDDEAAVSGSANIDMRSFFVNFEIGILHTSPSDLSAFRIWIEDRLVCNCRKYETSRIAGKGRARIFAENAAYMLTPLM
jgi:cardiolipin synthase